LCSAANRLAFDFVPPDYGEPAAVPSRPRQDETKIKELQLIEFELMKAMRDLLAKYPAPRGGWRTGLAALVLRICDDPLDQLIVESSELSQDQRNRHMSCTRLPVSLLVIALFGYAAIPARANEPFSNPPGGVAAKERITSVCVLKPGESQQLSLATWCTVGQTRSSGLEVGELKNGHFVTQVDKFNRGQVWQRDGLKVEVPGAQEAQELASTPAFATLKEQGIDLFVVKISTAASARPGLYTLHIQDSTCGGTCRTDLRVLVQEP